MSAPPEVLLPALTFAPVVTLYKLDLTAIQEPHDPGQPPILLYFTPMTTDLETAEGPDYPLRTFSGHRLLRLDGQEYEPVPVEVSGMERGGQGAVAQPTIRISNATRVFGDFLLGFAQLVGARLTRTIISDLYMDQPHATLPATWVNGDPDAWWDQQIYLLEELTSLTPEWAEWRLGADLDIEGRQVPGHQMFRDTCRLRYRVWDAVGGAFDYSAASCPYTGAGMFNYLDQTTAISTEDRCSRKLSGCRARFEPPNTSPAEPLPIDSFPGLGSRG